MSAKLKPLLLPQLVEERKQTMVHRVDVDGDCHDVYYTRNSSSSDITSPLTPTFSTRGHQRCSSSASSLDLPPTSSNDTPSSPNASTSTPLSATQSQKPGKRPLPDVQEEPMERDDEEPRMSDQFDLYGCLCDEPCIHRESDMIMTAYPADYDGIDYDCGFMSDSDSATHKLNRRQKSDLGSMASRFGTRFSGLSRWRSSKRSMSQLRTSPVTEFHLEHALPAMSRTGSSRSSSLSTPSRRATDRSNEPTMPPTPARSVWDSSESLHRVSSPMDMDKVEDRESLERERALATTPLLPPLLNGPLHTAPQQSPLQSPSVAPSPTLTDFPSPQPASYVPTPTLSAKQSVSSFRGYQDAQAQLEPQPQHRLEQPPPGPPAPIPDFLQEHDEWSDRLGHANFNISPAPYQPADPTLESLQRLRADWEAARVNYTKHIVRTGENYGQTSKIYALTEAKWAEIDRKWRENQERTIKAVPDLSSRTDDALPSFVSVKHGVGATGPSTSDSRSRSRGRGRLPGRSRAGSASVAIGGPIPANNTLAAMIPRLADAEGKFPARGDEDIVGPMVREAPPLLRAQSEDRKGRFWRSLVDKVGIKR